MPSVRAGGRALLSWLKVTWVPLLSAQSCTLQHAHRAHHATLLRALLSLASRARASCRRRRAQGSRSEPNGPHASRIAFRKRG